MPESRLELPLIARLTLTLAVAALLPVGISLYQLRTNADALLSQLERTHIVAASTTAARVDTFLDGQRRLADALANHPLVEGDPRSPAAQEVIASTLQAEPGVAAVRVQDADGEQVVLVQRTDRKEVIAPLLAAAVDLAAPRLEGTAGERWLRLDVALAGGGGALTLVSDAAPLDAMVRLDTLGDEARVVLARRDGEALAGEPQALRDLPDEVRAQIASGQLRAGAGKHGDSAVDETVAAYAQLTHAPWVVLSRQPARIAELARQRIRRATGVAVAGALALTLVFTAVAWNTVVRPLREVIRIQRRLAGDPSPAAVGGSEIVQLRASLDQLERRIRDREGLDQVFLGRYQVTGLVGAGSMGNVFRGWDPQLERPVALKTVRLDTARFHRGELTGRLRREAVTYARFSHPNIVTVYDMASADDAAFLAMELIEGSDLEAYIEAYAPLEPSEVIPIGLAIARALEAAHAHDLVHQDVKPGNVLLGSGGAIKVTDFGISQLTTAAVDDGNVVTGTPGYLPPESLENAAFSPRGDLFALGVVLYRALARRHPFFGRSWRDLLINTLVVEPRPVQELNPATPPALAQLVAELLSKDPDQRPDAAAARAVLESLAAESDLQWLPRLLPTSAPLPPEARTRLVPTRAVRKDAARAAR